MDGCSKICFSSVFEELIVIFWKLKDIQIIWKKGTGLKGLTLQYIVNKTITHIYWCITKNIDIFINCECISNVSYLLFFFCLLKLFTMCAHISFCTDRQTDQWTEGIWYVGGISTALTSSSVCLALQSWGKVSSSETLRSFFSDRPFSTLHQNTATNGFKRMNYTHLGGFLFGLSLEKRAVTRTRTGLSFSRF